MTITDLRVGHPVEPMAGETEIWPTLAVAALDTVVLDDQGQEWIRRDMWWSGPDGARLTSLQLGSRGPLIIVSVHVCEEWIDSTTMCSTTVTSTCVSCGMTKEVPR